MSNRKARAVRARFKKSTETAPSTTGGVITKKRKPQLKYSLIRIFATGLMRVKIKGLPRHKAEEMASLLNDELDVDGKIDRDEPYDHYGVDSDDSAAAYCK